MASMAEQLAANVNFSAFSKATELKKRLWFALGCLIVYRFGTYIPLPGIDPVVMAQIFEQNAGGIMGMFNMFSGGALERMSIFALGILPYISASIIMQLMTAVSPTIEQLKKEGEVGRTGALSGILIVFILVMAVAVITFIVFIERAQRRLLVQYPKRQQGNRMFGGESSHLPLKINVSGVIPPIFASSLLLMPATLASFGGAGGSDWLGTITAWFGRGQPAFLLIYVALIVFFAFFYTAIVFNPQDTADNLRKHGGFIPGIRPGQRTAEYLDYVLTRLTTVGAIYLAAVCVLPEILISNYGVPFYFGGTSLLIVVSVTMDTTAQIQSHLIAHQYEGLIRKSRLRGARRT